MFVTDKLGSLTHLQMIHIMNQHDPGSALVYNSFASTVCWRNSSLTQVTKRNTQSTIGVQFTFRHAIKADKKRKLKLKISNA